MDYQIAVTVISGTMTISGFVIGYVLGMQDAWKDAKKIYAYGTRL